ncbi:protocadherin Fat 4 isoform X2 [Seriola aureovittata]|uniref:protocadherin Fat 4 isoform X2 n=1 Tax=Seriola aureovittata TaxID=2871759 RepID=UPI0024BE4787|nr:protocadherin Fat 4 isoform X2 [Seriola aureovittata]
MMDSTGQRRKYTIFMFHFLVFNTASSHEPSSGNTVNVSSVRQFADTVLGQHMLPSWYYTSVDAVPEHGAVSLQSHNRWRTQMASSKTVYSFEVKEDTAPGTVVGKVETAFESHTPIAYSVQEDDGENLFLLSPLSGEFLLSRSLDFEAQRFYILTVAVQQGDLPVSSVRVYFSVLNVNDNPPVFSQDTFSASLLEDTRVGTCFLSLNASDKDEGDNGGLKLTVVDGDEETEFFINSVGSLCLNKELDRERQSSYNLTVTANDCVHPVSLQLTSTAHVIVVLIDVNDNAPLFVSAKSVSVPEDTALHSAVMTVHAEDEDTGSNGEVLYYLNSISGGTFSIDNGSGIIYLEGTLDREQVDTLTITITATDRGSPRMATTMNLTVHVEDANDHDPEFSRSTYNLTVREDIPRGTSLFLVRAHDRDIGPNGQVRYLLTQASPFVVDTVRGVLTVMDKLDRERESNYTLFITGVDQGDKPRSTTAAFSVTVLDINDSAPQFSPETLILHVMENEEDPAQLTHQLSALDKDLGVNSQLTYFIQNGNSDGLFSITPNGTFQILHSLDREKESLYIVTIIAVDSGLPPLTGTLTVQVIVDDINDNRPEFTEEDYNTIVSEDSPTGTVFAMIMASDIDEGVSGEIRYFMEKLDIPIAIEETSGELFTTDVLDRETVAIYRLTVIGSDKHPTQPLSSSVLVTVVIGDINDHWPRFTNSPYVAYVPTEMAPGSVVCAVRATDEDSEMNAELQYSLYGQSSDLFSINPFSGTVFTSSALRRTEDIIVNIHVEDAGENPKFDSTTMSIRFQNVSDFPEMNVDVLSYSLSEDEPVGTLVAVVSAVSVRAEPISFYLASGNFEVMFHVEQLSGALRVENPLDYENKKDFTLLVEARDSGSPPFSSFAEIHINISDVNDNFPQFTQAEYRCEVFENSPPSWVCDVLAIDADSGSYGTVRYNITEGNTDHLFAIDSENGLLSTTASLDRENIPKFSLIVEAAEGGNPLHRDRATVIIIVLDRNDNIPRFSQIFLTEVPEDAGVGHTVIQVTSTDDDTGPNAVINYSIIDQNDDIPFNIDFTTGYITVERLLDREMQDHYVLKVSANDSVWIISTDVTIVITDVNDNKPVFSDHFHNAVLPETKDKEVFVMQVLATDADVGQNSEILYVIEPPNEEFWVNATFGQIYTKQPLMLHHSAFEIYQFTVMAFDCGAVPLYSNATVTVRLEPYNHYPPMFLPLQPLIAIPYDMATGTEVIQFAAIDLDVNSSSANIEYVLNEDNASDFFWIQPDNGKVKLKQSLTENLNSFLTLIVVAKDQGTPPLSSQTEITFEITGRNQFSPSFREPAVTFSVPEDLPVGSVIGRIQAEDRDYGPNGAIMYCITPENQYLPFSVGEASGLLTLIRELDFEEEVIHQLQIKAADGGWVSRKSMLNVTVVVMDVNDNPPVFSYSEYLTSVPENSEIGTNVLDVKAADADAGINAQISYSIIAGHVDKFAIDSRNGTITTLDVFDYEREQIFDVTIKASNAGGYNLFTLAHVVIQIADINEFTPTFRKREFNFSVYKNVTVGTIIGAVTATDYDQGSEGQVFYLMFGQNKYIGFEINKLSGEIYTTGSLRKQGNSRIVLKVLAKNSGVITGMDVDETLVLISVIDTNDAPMFTSALYLANVTEDSPIGTSVITVSALDQDSILDWNRFFFSIESGNTNFSFAIDPPSGVISVNSPLDRELWAVYNLTVTATDNGSPPATGTTKVTVTIADVNDNTPELTLTEAQLKENQPQGTVVARLNASDSDLPPNQGPFTYWLVSPSTGSAFSLTPDGVLFTTRPIDREQISAYRVLLAVSDAGTPALSSTAIFHIRIVDENDNPSLPRNIFIEVKYFGSSFQGGMIGNVHPEDQDESDTFICGIKSGPLNMFTIPNGTCELWSSPFQGEATFNITIEATDQLHFPVNNSIYVNYKGFTNASIDSCILFYMSSSSMEEFLSNKYLRFVKALDSLFNLQASKTHVFGIKLIGSEILLLAAVKNYNGEYLSREVASGISAGHKKLLESQTNVMISHITSDPCLTSPCQNGAVCNKNIYIGQDVAVLESLLVIFVSPQKEVFNCTCPAGFTGTLCEDDIDECEVNPCKNKGTCVNTAGSFYCHCQSSFSGSICSIDVDECLKVKCQNGGTCLPAQDGYYCHCVPGYEGEMCEQFIDHCSSTPCIHGSCISSQTGFSCLCPFGVSGVHCEEHSFGFEELSFMEFPPLDRRANLISLEFATVQRNSLLLYSPGGSSSREFLALEILDGAIHLSYDLGSGPVRLQTNKQVADGYFHIVTARRIGNMGSLRVDNCTDVENNGFCFSESHGSGSERSLDVGNSYITFGGLRTIEFILLHPAQIKTHDFVGCIRNIHVNGIQLTQSMALVTYNILDRCPRTAVSPCHSDPCKNGGVCHDLWSDHLCECKSPFFGSDCAEESSEEFVLRLDGNDYIEYVIKERFKRDYLLKDSLDDEKEGNNRHQTVINIKFKTKHNGALMFVTGQTGYIMLKIKDRKPVFLSKDTLSGHLSEFTVDSTVADRVWHVLSLFSNGQITFLTLDGKPVLNITDRIMDLTPVSVEKIILGAALTGDSKLQQSGFSGCVQYFNVTGYTLPVSGHSVTVDIWPSPTLLQSSCISPGVCLPSPCSDEDTVRRSCLSGQCQTRWRCGPAVQNRSCICLHNVSDHACDICISTTESRDQCSEAEGSVPLWLIAVILPLISILVIIGMFLALYRVRRQNAKCQPDSLPQKTERGTDNVTFCFDDNMTLTDAAPAEKEKQHDPVTADLQRSSVEFYCDASLSSVQPEPNSELEYYEIGSISSAFHSDTSLELSWHKHWYSTKCAKADPKRWGDLKMLLTRFKKECSSEVKAKSPTKPQHVASLNKQLSEQPQNTPPCYTKKIPQPELLEPVQCLTFEEISKINAPLEQTMSHQASLRCGPTKSTTMEDVSFDSETDSTFTCSESECRQVSVISTRKDGHYQSSLFARSFRQQDILPVSTLFKHNCHSAAGQHKDDSTPSRMFERWENILNMHLPYSSYVPVFEDIVCLPMEPSQSYDMQSDTEEII